jgi:hypothetical protein
MRIDLARVAVEQYAVRYLPDACLSAKVPYLKLEVFKGDLLHVEADGGNGSDNLPNL